MPIFDQGYQNWDGKLSGHAWRWLAIARFGIAAQWKARAVRAVAILALAPALGLATFLVLWGLFEQQSSLLTPFLQFIQSLPEELKAGPKAFRGVYWTMAFHAFFSVELFFSMLLVLMVGPNLISQDLRSNAIPLYFSRPLRRVDYFLGKLGVISFYVALVSIVPAVLAYGFGVAFSFDADVFRDTGRLLLASVAYGAVVMVSAGTLMLAISSLTRNSRMVGAIWIGLWIVSGVSAGILTESVKRDWCPIVSYGNDLLRIREAMFDTASARTRIRTLFEAGQDQVRQSIFPFGRRNRRPSPPPRVVRPARPGMDADGNSIYPWQWSAGVLAGLTGLSIWTLSSRVKSLDRLR